MTREHIREQLDGFIIIAMPAEASSGSAAGPSADAVRAVLARILASRQFARSQRQQEFLRHVVESAIAGRGDCLKELTLGIEVFKRGSAFDPRSDNIVRVEARRLRQRLREYYETEGGQDEVRIELPVGNYTPRFCRQERAMPAGVGNATGRLTLRRYAWAALTAVLVLAAGAGAAWYGSSSPASIAVLPFVDLGPGGERQYAGDGIAETVTQELSETARLRVVARTSAFQFRRTGTDAREIGRRLGADLLLEGSLQPSGGNGYRVTARLVNAGSGFEVWSRSVESGADGFDSAAQSIAAGVAAALKASLRPHAPARMPAPQAQDLVMQARYLAARGGVENRRQAVVLYEKALAADPGYVRAMAELARLWSIVAFHDWKAARELAPRIKAMAARALELDESLADAHLAVARVAWFHDWDWAAAERSFARALEINTNHAGARQAYALALMSRGRFGKALAESRKAAELDPLSYAASNDLGVIYYVARRFDEAAAHAKRALTMEPNALFPRFLAGVVASGQSRYSEAILDLEKAATPSREPEILGRLGNAYALGGRRRDALAVLAELETNPEGGAIYAAMVHTGLAERQAAVEDLARAAERRETDCIFVAVDPVFDPLRREPGFRLLCQKLGVAAE